MFQLKVKNLQTYRDILTKISVCSCGLLKRIVSSEGKTMPFMKMVVFTGFMKPVLAKEKNRINLMMTGLIFMLIATVIVLVRIVLVQDCYGRREELNEEDGNEISNSSPKVRPFLLRALDKQALICFFVGMPFLIGSLN